MSMLVSSKGVDYKSNHVGGWDGLPGTAGEKYCTRPMSYHKEGAGESASRINVPVTMRHWNTRAQKVEEIKNANRTKWRLEELVRHYDFQPTTFGHFGSAVLDSVKAHPYYADKQAEKAKSAHANGRSSCRSRSRSTVWWHHQTYQANLSH